MGVWSDSKYMALTSATEPTTNSDDEGITGKESGKGGREQRRDGRSLTVSHTFVGNFSTSFSSLSSSQITQGWSKSDPDSSPGVAPALNSAQGYMLTNPNSKQVETYKV